MYEYEYDEDEENEQEQDQDLTPTLSNHTSTSSFTHTPSKNEENINTKPLILRTSGSPLTSTPSSKNNSKTNTTQNNKSTTPSSSNSLSPHEKSSRHIGPSLSDLSSWADQLRSIDSAGIASLAEGREEPDIKEHPAFKKDIEEKRVEGKKDDLEGKEEKKEKPTARYTIWPCPTPHAVRMPFGFPSPPPSRPLPPPPPRNLSSSSITAHVNKEEVDVWTANLSGMVGRKKERQKGGGDK